MMITPALSRPRFGAAFSGRFAGAVVVFTTLLTILWVAPASAEPVLEVDVGVNDYYNPGRSVPVRVTVSADRLIDGRLDVVYPDNRGRTSTARVEVSMTGGTVKSFVVTVPTSPWQRTALTVNLVEGDTILAQAEPRLTPAGADDLVAVLPGLAARSNVPNTARVIGDLGTARLGTLDLDDLSLGPAALDSLDTLIGLPNDFADLTATEQGVVLSWLDAGGMLIVDGSPGDTPWLPTAWQPDERGKSRAGAGEVRLSSGDAAAGRWDDLFPPTRTRTSDEEQMLNEFGGGVWFGSIQQSIAQDVNLRSIGLGLATALLIGYAVVAGPLLFLVLRRTGRHSLAWAIIPILAFVGTGAAVASRSSFRPADATGHATILTTSPAGSRATSFVLVGSGNGGTETVELPDTFQATTIRNEDGGVAGTQVSHNDRIDVQLPPGGYGLVAATGQAPESIDVGELTVATISTGPTSVESTVTNASNTTLEDVAVVVGSTGTLVGSLAPGESATVTIDDVGRIDLGQPRDVNWWPGLEDQWFGPRGFPGNQDPDDEDSIVSGGLWTEVNQSGGSNFRPLGAAVAVGWRSDVASPLDDGAFDVGTTMVMGRGTVEPGGDHLFGIDVSRTLVRGPFGVDLDLQPQERGPEFFGEDALGAYRFELPATVDGRPVDNARLVAQLPDAAVAEVWVGDEWIALRNDIGGATVIGLPEGAAADGTVLIKFGFSLERIFNGGRHSELMIRESTPDDDVALAAGLESAESDSSSDGSGEG